jgi:hypothetical protein
MQVELCEQDLERIANALSVHSSYLEGLNHRVVLAGDEQIAEQIAKSIAEIDALICRLHAVRMIIVRTHKQ